MSSKTFLADRIEQDAIQWLARLNSSTLTPAEEQTFMQWLEASPLHQAAYIKAEQLWERGLVLQKLPQNKIKPAMQMERWQTWALACICFIAVSLAIFYQVNATSTYEYKTAIGEQKEFKLDDGSHIQLNINSALRFEINRKSRTAYLTQGEVFFDVKKDGRHFDVVTDYGSVRVLGTHFSVYKTASDALVTVIEGRVALGERKQAEFTTNTILQTNQRLSLQSAKAGQLPEQLNANSALAWRKKQLVFKGQTLNQVIAELSRYFPIAIKLKKPELGEREITAVVPLSDMKTTLGTLTQSLNLQMEFDGANVTLESR